MPDGPHKELLDGADELSPRYDLLSRLGKGGMGEVVEAFDRRLRREVAVKVLRVAQSDDEDVKRFLREAQVTGRLDHPHVPPVHDLGRGPDGALFFSMKRLSGRTLSEIVKKGELSRHQRLEIFLKVCDAVAYAHARGVVHRDLKPSNVMVGAFREVYVLDWGLAKHVGDEEPSTLGRQSTDPDASEEPLTSGGSVLGTPGYMSPEQARGEHHRIDARSDVYSLGVLLYVLLCGAGPFARGRAALEQVRAGRFEPPAKRSPGVPRELDAVVLCAMELHPDRRFQTVEELRAEVSRWIEGQPLQTVTYTARQRATKLAWRNRRPLALAAALASFVGLFVVFLLAANLVSVSVARDAALDAERRAQLSLADSEVALAHAEADLGRLQQALDALDRAEARYRSLGGRERKAALARSVLAMRYPPAEVTWRADQDVRLVAPSADGERVLVLFPDGGAIHALPTGRVLASFPRRGDVSGAWLGDRALGVIAEGADASRVVDLVTGEPISPPLPHPGKDRVGGVSWLVDDGRVVVQTSVSGGTYAWRVADGTPLAQLDRAYVFAVAPGGTRMAGYEVVGGIHRSAESTLVWDVATGAVVAEQPVTGIVAFSRDGRLEVRHEGDEIALVDLDLGTELWRSPSLPAARVAWARDEDVVAIVGSDQRMVALDAATGGQIGERRMVSGLTASHGQAYVPAQGDRVLTLVSGTLRLWSLGAGDDAPRLRAGDERLTAVELSADGLLAATAGWDGVVRLWEWRSKSLLREVRTAANGTRDVTFSKDGRFVLTADRDGAGRLVRTDTGEIARELRTDGATLASGALFVDGDAVVTYETGRIVAFDPESGEERWRLQGSIDNPWAVALSPDGRRLAVTSRARNRPILELWDLERKAIAVTGPVGDAGYRVAFSPDGRRVAVGSHEGNVDVFDVDGDGFERIGGRAEAIQAVGWSPDGTLLAVGGYDGQLDLYDAADLGLLQSVPLHDASIVDVALAPLDGTVLTASGDGTLGILDPARWERLGPTSVVLDRDPQVPPTDGARWLELAAGAALRANWAEALDDLLRAEAAGVTIAETDRARALWALGRTDEARAALDRALAAGGGATLRAWREAP